MAVATFTVRNGTFPVAALAIVPGFNTDHSPHRMLPDAAAALARLIAAARDAGFTLLPSPGYSTYRTRLQQQHMRDVGLTTIPVGQSIHGEARAIDLYDVGGFDSQLYAWLAANGPSYGFYQPMWARKRGALPEYWHWEYDPDLDRHIPTEPTATSTAVPTPEGILMALTDQQQTDLLNAVGQLDRLLGPAGETTGKIDTLLQWVSDVRGGVAGLPAILAATRGDVDPAAIAAEVGALLPTYTVTITPAIA